jgi:hypothetical protein
MGVRSTYTISRDTAIKVLASKIYDLTNEELASILYELKESTFRNYWVVDVIYEDEDSPVIGSPWEFDNNY